VVGATNRLAAAGYDASGNMTAWMSFSFTWDALDRMRALAGHGLHRRCAATADGERVVEREGSTSTFSLRGLDNRVLREMKATWTGAGWAWDWEKDSIWGAGRLLASVSRRDGLRHAHVDHLGSPRLVTNRCGQRVALLDHNPWGLDRPTGVQDGERHRFTAHQRDLGQLDRTWDDFDYLHARYYSPLLARFVSVDPGRDNDLRAPQSWNLYAYVRNSPLVQADRTGGAAVLVVAIPPAHAMAAAASAAVLAWLNAESSTNPGRSNAQVMASNLERLGTSLYRWVGSRDQVRARDRGYLDHLRSQERRRAQRSTKAPDPERPGGGDPLPPAAPGSHTRVGERPQDPLTPNELGDIAKVGPLGPVLTSLGAEGTPDENGGDTVRQRTGKRVPELHPAPPVILDVRGRT